jgi:hypothetical protein
MASRYSLNLKLFSIFILNIFIVFFVGVYKLVNFLFAFFAVWVILIPYSKSFSNTPAAWSYHWLILHTVDWNIPFSTYSGKLSLSFSLSQVELNPQEYWGGENDQSIFTYIFEDVIMKSIILWNRKKVNVDKKLPLFNYEGPDFVT